MTILLNLCVQIYLNSEPQHSKGGTNECYIFVDGFLELRKESVTAQFIILIVGIIKRKLILLIMVINV